MIKNSIEAQPNGYTRIGGKLYLIVIALGIFSQVFVRNQMIVAGDTASTAANFASNERVGIATDIVH